MKRDDEGLGGFFEAILAVMIVTSGFTILLVSINLVQDSERKDTEIDVIEKVQVICRKLMEDKRIFQPPYIMLLGNAFLWDEIAEDDLSDFVDYSVTLIVDLECPRNIVLAQKGFSINPEEIISLRMPVDVQITPSTVHVGILEVKVGV